jgi:5-methylthioadenosine/S-adenosylhomocysteine deaminase
MENTDILIINGHIITLNETSRIIENGFVAVHGDTIFALDSMDHLPPSRHARRIIDAKGGIVMPGLINAHTHAAMTCFRGIADDMELLDWLNHYIFPAEAKNLSPELVYWGSLLACAEMIKSGTTTFCDMYIFEDEVARAAKQAGMRCLLGEGLFDFPSPNNKTPQSALAYTKRFIEKWSGDPLINIAIAPHSLYSCSETLLLAARDMAREYRLPLVFHLLESKEEVKILTKKLRMKASDYLREKDILGSNFVAFHCVCMDDDDIAVFADHGCNVVHNPESNMKLASGIAPVTKMINKGIPVALGTDGCASNNNLDLFQEMDTAAKLGKLSHLNPTDMPAQTVLAMATRYGAHALGMKQTTGELKPGMKADVIIIDMDKPHLTPMYNPYSHLVYTVGGADVDTVLINGQLVMENRRLITIDEGRVLAEVRRIAEKVRASIVPATS